MVQSGRGDLTASSQHRAARLAQFEELMRMPLALSAVLPIAIGLSGDDGPVSVIVAIVTWLVFVVDLLVHMRMSTRYLRTGFGRFDLAIVVLTAAWFLIPGLGSSAFLMLARLGRLGRLFLGTALGRTLMARLSRVGLLAGSSLLLLSWIAYHAERGTNPEFADYGDALWWGIVTMTTVGYGDIVPITTDGRVTGALMMLAGLALIGSLAGILASFLQVEDEDDSTAEGSRGTDGGPGPASVGGAEEAGAELAALRAAVADLQAVVARMDERRGSEAGRDTS